MSEHNNGNQFELGRIVGQLQTYMDRSERSSEHLREASITNTAVLEQIAEDIRDLPDRLSEIMRGSATPKESMGGMKDLADLLRSIYPYLMFVGVLIGKTMWPQYLPVIRAALEAAAKAHSGMN
jgi:hypothetical protein